MLGICWLTPVGWKAAPGLIWGDYLKNLESLPVSRFSFVKQKTLNLSFQTALRESEFTMLHCIAVHGLYVHSVQGFKLLSELWYRGLHLWVCFNFFIMKKGLHVKFKAKFSVPWYLRSWKLQLWLVVCQLFVLSQEVLSIFFPFLLFLLYNWGSVSVIKKYHLHFHLPCF